MRKIFILTFCFLLLPVGSPVLAQLNQDTWTGIANEAGDAAEGAGFERSTGGVGLENMVEKVISTFLSVLAIVFIILILTAGYGWMTAGGDEQKVTKAKDTLRRAIIGLLIIAGAYAITWFVFSNVPFGDGGSSSSSFD